VHRGGEIRERREIDGRGQGQGGHTAKKGGVVEKSEHPGVKAGPDVGQKLKKGKSQKKKKERA